MDIVPSLGMSQEKKPASLIALERLILKLKNREFAIGEPIRESLLADELNLSRNAIREALNQLVAWRVMEYVPYCGYRMVDFTWERLLQWAELREAIEPIAARNVALSHTPEMIVQLDDWLTRHEAALLSGDSIHSWEYDMMFHLAVIENCCNPLFDRLCVMLPILYNCASNLNGESFLYLVENSTSERLSESFSHEEFDKSNIQFTIDTHRKMLQLIKDGQAGEAEAMFRIHVGNQARNIRKIIEYCNFTKKLSTW